MQINSPVLALQSFRAIECRAVSDGMSNIGLISLSIGAVSVIQSAPASGPRGGSLSQSGGSLSHRRKSALRWEIHWTCPAHLVAPEPGNPINKVRMTLFRGAPANYSDTAGRFSPWTSGDLLRRREDENYSLMLCEIIYVCAYLDDTSVFSS